MDEKVEELKRFMTAAATELAKANDSVFIVMTGRGEHFLSMSNATTDCQLQLVSDFLSSRAGNLERIDGGTFTIKGGKITDPKVN